MLLAMPALTALAMLAGFFGGLEMGLFLLDINPQTLMRYVRLSRRIR
jgi:ABC-type transporter Mla maintaining outer membrane lipid asymmetry permease subunit MlaE